MLVDHTFDCTFNPVQHVFRLQTGKAARQAIAIAVPKPAGTVMRVAVMLRVKDAMVRWQALLGTGNLDFFFARPVHAVATPRLN